LTGLPGHSIKTWVVEVTPSITQETMLIGQTWGEKLGQDIVDKLIADGYISN
jgi:hypothetical protein